jgi:hypothetical protein
VQLGEVVAVVFVVTDYVGDKLDLFLADAD